MDSIIADLPGLLIILAIIFVSMVLHEYAHGWVAYKLGDSTAKTDGRLTLNPLKHIDPVMSILVPLVLALAHGPIFGGAKPVPINPYKLRGGEWGMALVAFAGPLTNFILALLCFLFLVIFAHDGRGFLAEVLILGFSINMGFGIFNLIPIPPLDGSRILYAVAPDAIRDVMDYIERYGIILVFILIVLFSGFFGKIIIGGTQAVFDILSSIFHLHINLYY